MYAHAAMSVSAPAHAAMAERSMPILMMHDVSGGTIAQYDHVIRELEASRNVNSGDGCPTLRCPGRTAA